MRCDRSTLCIRSGRTTDKLELAHMPKDRFADIPRPRRFLDITATQSWSCFPFPYALDHFRKKVRVCTSPTGTVPDLEKQNRSFEPARGRWRMWRSCKIATVCSRHR